MCRISGIVDPSKPVEELESMVKAMCLNLQHGGPDGEGIFISTENSLVFGHRRLALLDLSEAGKQPMSYDNGRLWITYNGEIYNYPALKKELEKLGYTFKTVCDTEMILIAFHAWGMDAFKKFKGMFAFALLDNHVKKLYLVRDSSGIKPLYYSIDHKRLIFASEIRALKLFPQYNIPDERAKILLLAYGHIPEPVTTLKNVMMLAKGSALTFELNTGSETLINFRQYTYSEQLNNREQAEEMIHEDFDLSVKAHLLSDAPIGVFLSGGIDSSLLALIAHQHSGERLNTLSLYFNEQQYSEKKYQDMIIQSADCNHAQYLLTGEEFSKNFEQVINDMDLPCTDGINTWFISKYAKAFGLKAVLSGVGSDEIFGGYPSFKRMGMVKLMEKFSGKNSRKLFQSLGQKAERAAYLSIPGTIGKYLFLRGIFIPAQIAQLLHVDEEQVWKTLGEVPVLRDISSLSSGNQASWIEMNLYMQNQLLRDSDVMSMAHGIEIRVPFLDDRLIIDTLKINSKVKYAGKRPKQILIDSFKNVLPEPVWNRPKMGFTFPFREWLKKNDFVSNTMESNKTFSSLYKKFNAGQLPWSHIMAIMVLQNKINE